MTKPRPTYKVYVGTQFVSRHPTEAEAVEVAESYDPSLEPSVVKITEGQAMERVWLAHSTTRLPPS